jgi:hypothetical protein
MEKQRSNLKKQGKSWLPITMIRNFGNVISGPVPSIGRFMGVVLDYTPLLYLLPPKAQFDIG